MAKKSKKKKKKNKNQKRSVANRPVESPTTDTSPEVFEDDSTDEDDIDVQYRRIFKILDIENTEDEDAEDEDAAEVNLENLEKYLAYIEKEISFPLFVTGIEDMGCFGWEEFYTFGPGSKEEYDKLRKTRPSFRDKYEILSLSEDIDEEEGLYVKVKRLSDKKEFNLTLADLKTVDENSKNTQLLHDYAVWYTNFW